MEARLRPGGGEPVPVVFTRLMAWAGGFAARRDWPDGTHEFFGFSTNPGRVMRRLARDERFWRRGPLRPTRRTVVYLSRHAFRGHEQCCRDPRCVGGLTLRAGVGVRP